MSLQLVVRVSVIEARGSTPREVGAAMTVSSDGITGTIGGGALEHNAIATARTMLDQPLWYRTTHAYPLGPSLGQCCGGFNRLLFEVVPEKSLDEPENGLVIRQVDSHLAPVLIEGRHDRDANWPLGLTRAVQDMMSGATLPHAVLVPGAEGTADWYLEPVRPARQTLFLYGAGHVGRAVVRALTDLPFDIMWVDTAADRFPDPVPQHVTAVPAADPATIARHAPADAFHVVMTYSHALDLGICQSVLARGQFAYLGVIGSDTKRERFTRRLGDTGIAPGMISRMVCPIGLPGLDGKEPAIIAASLAADLLQRLSIARNVSMDIESGSTMSS